MQQQKEKKDKTQLKTVQDTTLRMKHTKLIKNSSIVYNADAKRILTFRSKS